MTAAETRRPSSFPPVPLDSDDPQVQRAYANSHELFGHVSDLFARLAHAPALLDGWIDFLRPIRRDLQVDPHLSELLTLRVAQLQRAQIMVDSHTRLAVMAGVASETIAAVTDEWRDSSVLGELERLVLELAEQIAADSEGDDEVIRRLQELIGIRETLELVLVASFYCCTTRAANILRPSSLTVEENDT